MCSGGLGCRRDSPLCLGSVRAGGQRGAGSHPPGVRELSYPSRSPPGNLQVRELTGHPAPIPITGLSSFVVYFSSHYWGPYVLCWGPGAAKLRLNVLSGWDFPRKRSDLGTRFLLILPCGLIWGKRENNEHSRGSGVGPASVPCI